MATRGSTAFAVRGFAHFTRLSGFAGTTPISHAYSVALLGTMRLRLAVFAAAGAPSCFRLILWSIVRTIAAPVVLRQLCERDRMIFDPANYWRKVMWRLAAVAGMGTDRPTTKHPPQVLAVGHFGISTDQYLSYVGQRVGNAPAMIGSRIRPFRSSVGAGEIVPAHPTLVALLQEGDEVVGAIRNPR
jgi:hypothetical protein